jgi:type VI protein secretion system component VasF
MDILSRFRFPGFFERRKAPRPAERSEQPRDEEQARFAGFIPILVPLAAVVLATLVYFIFYSLWEY